MNNRNGAPAFQNRHGGAVRKIIWALDSLGPFKPAGKSGDIHGLMRRHNLYGFALPQAGTRYTQSHNTKSGMGQGAGKHGSGQQPQTPQPTAATEEVGHGTADQPTAQ